MDEYGELNIADGDPLARELCDFVDGMSDYYETEHYVFVHGWIPVLSDTAFVYDAEADLTLFMSHGHKYSPDNMPPISGKTVFLYGHTHLLGKTEVGGIPCVNPGSISLPKGGNEKSYAIYECGELEIKTFEGKTLGKYKF